jgi:isocitrate dehydrogenase kinase/phosphatase
MAIALDAAAAAQRTLEAYEQYREAFQDLTRRVRYHFERCDWLGAQQDALNRLLLYGHMVEPMVSALRQLLGTTPAPALGGRVKEVYAGLIAGRPDLELAESFFNSAMRRAFHVAGVNPLLEFSGEALDEPPPASPDVRTWEVGGAAGELEDVIACILRELPLGVPYRDVEGDAALAAAAIRAEHPGRAYGRIELLTPLFYRNKGAYAVGRMVCRGPGESCPLVLALTNEPGGLVLDAVLLTADEASIVFGFTRSYFHVETEHPRALLEYLSQIMPHKRLDELYTGIGYNRHGKAELYRALMRHLRDDGGRLEPAPGTRGTVMTVFTLPTFNVVFKIIRDRFDQPKRTDREAVRRKYELIFTSDRVGRLADAQEFEHLVLDRANFSDETLRELTRVARRTVRVDGERVLLDHLYTERRITPLNLFLREAPDEEALEAVLDYGQAIHELAAANIFTGDLLLKNFGVTRHGRIIFYDYDEVEHLTDVVFRRMPAPRTPEDELADTPWFHVGEHDVFPEEFPRFLGLPAQLREPFLAAHGHLFTCEFWQDMQERQRAGEIVDFFPYPQSRRLRGG